MSKKQEPEVIEKVVIPPGQLVWVNYDYIYNGKSWPIRFGVDTTKDQDGLYPIDQMSGGTEGVHNLMGHLSSFYNKQQMNKYVEEQLIKHYSK